MFFLVIYLFAIANLTSASKVSIGCYVEGECKNSLLIDFHTSVQPGTCHQFCKDTPGCHFFTHNTKDDVCFAFANCVEFSTESCDDCISGGIDCEMEFPDCFVSAECDGTVIDRVTSVDDRLDCLDLCFDDEDCKYWTWDPLYNSCEFYSSCKLDSSCSSCVSGERTCRDVFYNGCDMEIFGTGGIIQSVGYPYGYPDGFTCNYLIKVPGRKSRVNLKFDDVSFEYSSIECDDGDRVIIYDGPEANSFAEIGRACNSEIPTDNFTTFGYNQMLVQMFTDTMFSNRGFQATFSIVED